MGRKILAVSLALVLVLSFAACGGDDYPPVEEIVENASQAMADTSTCQFNMDMSMNMDGEVEGEAMEMSMEVDGSGALDIENYQVQMTMNMNTAVPGEDEMDIDMELYLVDNTYYIMMDIPGMGPMWMKTEPLDEMLEEIPEEYWELTELLEMQEEFLEAFEIEVTGSQKVDGVDCYVLESNPDMEQFWQMSMQVYETMGLEMTDIPENYEDIMDEMFREFSVKQWIAKDNYLTMKVEAELTMEIDPEAMGYPEEEGGISLDMTMTMLVNDYNQPVSIELPPEAAEATEMPMDYFSSGGY